MALPRRRLAQPRFHWGQYCIFVQSCARVKWRYVLHRQPARLANPVRRQKEPLMTNPTASAAGLQLTQGLRRAVEIRGRETAVVCGDRRFSWRELHERVGRLAAGLRALGLEDGDRVALLSVNTHHALETYF